MSLTLAPVMDEFKAFRAIEFFAASTFDFREEVSAITTNWFWF
jgi:hypothetical protein